MTDLIYRGVTKDGKVVEGWYKNTNGAIIKDEKTWSDFDIIPESLALSTGIPDKHGRMIFGSVPVNGQMSNGGDVVKVYENVNGVIKDWTNEVLFKSGCFSLVNRDCCEICKNGFGITMHLDESLYYGEVEIIGSQWEEKG